MHRKRIEPALRLSFKQVYKVVSGQPRAQTPALRTTGGVLFMAAAKEACDGRRFISLPHQNRIYEDDWGFQTNAMGRDGQRIGHYSVPLDEWAATQSSGACQSECS